MRRTGIHECLHVRQCVEKKMRRDLRLQKMQARVERLTLELTALERERELLIASEGLLLPDDRHERRPRRDQNSEERKHHPPVHPVGHLPERRRASGRGQNVDQQCRERHEDADCNDLKCPSLDPGRQRRGKQFEKREGCGGRQTHDDRAQEGSTPPSVVHHQERDGDGNRQRDGNAPRCLRNQAGRSCRRRQFRHRGFEDTVMDLNRVRRDTAMRRTADLRA